MDKILDKLSTYSIFNYLFPGAVFCIVVDRYFSIPLLQESIIDGLFLYHFVGLTISRFGSIVIEPILKKLKIIRYSDYADFVDASKVDQKIETLSESNNMYRSLLYALLLLCLVIFLNKLVSEYPDSRVYIKYALLPALIVLFGFSYSKSIPGRSAKSSLISKVRKYNIITPTSVAFIEKSFDFGQRKRGKAEKFQLSEAGVKSGSSGAQLQPIERQ